MDDKWESENPTQSQCHTFKKQLVAKYPFNIEEEVNYFRGGFCFEIDNAGAFPFDPRDVIQFAKLKNDLKTSKNPEHFFPIFKAMKDFHGWFDPSFAFATRPRATSARLEQIRHYPRIAAKGLAFDPTDPDFNCPDGEVVKFANWASEEMKSTFHHLFKWDYTKPNDKLTDDEWDDLNKYINYQCVLLKSSDMFDPILDDLTPAEVIEENVALAKAIVAANKGSK